MSSLSFDAVKTTISLHVHVCVGQQYESKRGRAEECYCKQFIDKLPNRKGDSYDTVSITLGAARAFTQDSSFVCTVCGYFQGRLRNYLPEKRPQ